MEKVTIKVLPNPDNPQLAMKYIGANEYIQPGTGEDGKVITGLDENALHITRISDDKERKTIQEKIKKERLELERLLGQDLGPHAPFWDKFFVVLNDEVELYSDNPMHRIIEKVLVANRKVAPSLEAIKENEDFIDCVFYLYREEEEMSKEAQRQMKYDKVVSEVYRLSEDNPRKLLTLYSFLFGYNAADILPGTAYVKIKEFLNPTSKTEKTRNLEKVLKALEKSPEELSTKLLLDKGIKKKIVTHKGEVYRRGDLLLGNNYDEALEFLLSVEHSAELLSLKKEIDKG